MKAFTEVAAGGHVIRVSNELLDHLASIPSKNAFYMLMNYPTTGEKGDYLDITNDGKISWRPLNRLEGIDDPFVTTGRVKGKPAKALKAFVREQLTDREWEVFNNQLTARLNPVAEESIALVSGEDIRHHYRRANMSPNARFYSCMDTEQAQPWLDVFTQNPNIQLLVALDGHGKMEARALVWTTIDGSIHLDSVYGSEVNVQKLRNYAQAQGWRLKTYNGWGADTQTLQVQLEELPTRGYPHPDWFMHIDLETKILSTSTDTIPRGHRYVSMYNTNGTARESTK